MDKENFMLREIAVIGEYGVSAYRTRNSNGFCSITVKVLGAISADEKGTDRKTQSITFDSGDYAHNYEQVAGEVKSVLDEIISDPCTLPKADVK